MAALHRVYTDKPVSVYQVIPPDNAFQVFDLGFVLKVTATICYLTLLSDIVRLNQSVAPFLAMLDISNVLITNRKPHMRNPEVSSDLTLTSRSRSNQTLSDLTSL